ncbi:MAG: hypothetical protein LUI08_01420 [Prevotella sp.]|nr:hypothetical protein [Prevotella sp.]
MKSIVESLAVLKKGGVLYLNHHVNEAETEKYKGFHKYNICEENGNLIIWNKACSHNAGEEIADFATFESVERNPETGHVTAVIRKTNDVPARLLSDKNDKRELCEMLIKMTRQDLCGNAMLKRKAAFWTYNAVQFLAQSLPWEVKMKLKQFIKQA